MLVQLQSWTQIQKAVLQGLLFAILSLFMQTKKDASFGVIPIRKAGDTWEVFLIHQFSKIGNNSYWIFPKGHPEGEETQKESALRELKEETGMTPEELLEEPTFNLEYSFQFDGVKIQKTVKFFIGIMGMQDHLLDEIEVKEAGWYSLEAAAERLDYQDTKQMYQQARTFLETYT